MGCLGVHFALDDIHVAALRALPEDERVDHVQEEIEEKLWSADRARGMETDKAWDAMHRALTDGDLSHANGEFPLSHVVLGGESLYDDEDYILSLKTPAEVGAIATAIAAVTRDQLRAGYDEIDPDDYGAQLGDEDFEYTWVNFSDVVEFYRRAAADGRWVLFTADQ